MALKLFRDSEPTDAELEALKKDIEFKKVTVDGKEQYQLVIDTSGTEFTVENTSDLRTALSKEREAKKAALKNLKAFDGLDAEEAREALEKLEKFGGELPDDEKIKQRIESVRKQLQEQHAEALKSKDDRNAQLLQQLSDVLIESSASTALRTIGGDEDTVEMLLPLLTKKAKLVEEDGKFQVHILGEDGNPIISKKSTGNMTFEEYVSGLKDSDRFSRAFPAKGVAGSGSNRGGAGGPERKPARKEGPSDGDIAELSPAERLKAHYEAEATAQ